MGMIVLLPVEVMAKVLCGRAFFVHAIRRSHSPTKLERQDDEHENGYQAAHNRKYIGGSVVRAKDSACDICPQDAQAVGHHEQTGAHVGKHGHPHGCLPKDRQDEKDHLDPQGQRDVLP